jgi:hypothetical protein
MGPLRIMTWSEAGPWGTPTPLLPHLNLTPLLLPTPDSYTNGSSTHYDLIRSRTLRYSHPLTPIFQLLLPFLLLLLPVLTGPLRIMTWSEAGPWGTPTPLLSHLNSYSHSYSYSCTDRSSTHYDSIRSRTLMYSLTYSLNCICPNKLSRNGHLSKCTNVASAIIMFDKVKSVLYIYIFYRGDK